MNIPLKLLGFVFGKVSKNVNCVTNINLFCSTCPNLIQYEYMQSDMFIRNLTDLLIRSEKNVCFFLSCIKFIHNMHNSIGYLINLYIS